MQKHLSEAMVPTALLLVHDGDGKSTPSPMPANYDSYRLQHINYFNLFQYSTWDQGSNKLHV